MSEFIHESVLQYAAQGIAIFPCRARDKRPATQHGLKDASADFKQVCAWWKAEPHYNIGLPTGAINSIVVVDIDGDEGRETWHTLIAQHGTVQTLTANTGKGLHLYFNHPGREIKNAVRVLPGLDIRGDGGYVIAPPSVHPSGAVYEWAIDAPKADLPAWLLELLLNRPAPVQSESVIEPKDAASIATSNDATQRHIQAVIDFLRNAKEGERNNSLLWAACRLLDKGMGLPDVEQTLVGVAVNIGLAERETLATIRSAANQARRTTAAPRATHQPRSFEQRQRKQARRLSA